MGFDLIPEAGAGADEIYLETASVVTTFILAGRYFEARAKRRAGAALKALLELGAKDVAVLDADGSERRVPDRAAAGRRSLPRAPGREGGHRRDRRGGHLGGGHEHADRRIGPGRGPARLRGRGRHGQRRRAPGGPRDQGRRRHRAGADGRARHRGPDRQGAGAAPGRPRLGRVRARGDRRGRRHARVLARDRRERDVRVHRRRGRAHHRLPLRARPRHPHRAVGRHGPRRAARPAHQGTRGARIHAQGRHGRARQDRHRHDRQDGARRGRRRRWGRPRRGAAARGRAGERLRAPHRPGHRQCRPGRAGPAARGRGLREPRGPRRRGPRGGPRARGRAAGPARATGRCISPPSSKPRAGPPRATARPPSPPAGTAEATAVFVVADTVKPTSAEAVASLEQLGLRPVLLTGDNERRRRPSPPRSASQR